MKKIKQLCALLLVFFIASCDGTMKKFVKESGDKKLKILVTYSKELPRRDSRFEVKSNAPDSRGYSARGSYPYPRDLDSNLEYPAEYDKILDTISGELKQVFSNAEVTTLVNNGSLPSKRILLSNFIDFENLDYDMVVTAYPLFRYNVQINHPSYSCGKETCYNYDVVDSYVYTSSATFDYTIHAKDEKGKMKLKQGKQFFPVYEVVQIVKNDAYALDEIWQDLDPIQFVPSVEKRIMKTFSAAFK